ncbi:hypothetical protein L615_001600000540 [Nocardioides sp. J9]|nr:hypothetical protein L615_001600000540 [Nocardioides sp. J9]
MPALALQSLATDGIEALDLPGLGMRRIVLRYLTQRRNSPSLDALIQLVRETAADFSYNRAETRTS